MALPAMDLSRLLGVDLSRLLGVDDRRYVGECLQEEYQAKSTKEQLKNEFDSDKTRNMYFSEIDTLHKSIFQESLDIKGKCRLCHPG
jgi:hypothetical protein